MNRVYMVPNAATWGDGESGIKRENLSAPQLKNFWPHAQELGISHETFLAVTFRTSADDVLLRKTATAQIRQAMVHVQRARRSAVEATMSLRLKDGEPFIDGQRSGQTDTAVAMALGPDKRPHPCLFRRHSLPARPSFNGSYMLGKLKTTTPFTGGVKGVESGPTFIIGHVARLTKAMCIMLTSGMTLAIHGNIIT